MLSFFNWGWGSSPKPSSSPANTNQNTSQPPSDPAPPPSEPPIQPPPPLLNTNLKLLFGGMTFFGLSLLITRRAFTKKRLSSIPPFYTGSIYHQPRVNGGMEAFEALNLATINVLSFGMMSTGAVLYAFDINGLEDMRRIVRGGLEGADSGKTDEELEREVTEWVVGVLGDRFEKRLEEEKLRRLHEGKGDGGGGEKGR